MSPWLALLAALLMTSGTSPGSDDADVAALWQRALEHEARKDPAAAAALYEELARRMPAEAEPRWRAAKSHWNRGVRLPKSDRAGRRAAYRVTREWAAQGLELDPQCGECCLYLAAGIGGEARDDGALAGARQVSEIAHLLERGIAILSARPDADHHSELEELYYAAAQLYRRVPDWGVVRWALGVPGDRRRAVEYMRRARHIAGNRPDYAVELGALLLCTGHDENDEALKAEGIAVLEEVLLQPADEVGAIRVRAQTLLGQPDEACDYSE